MLNYITDNERQMLNHLSRWGSDACPIRKVSGGRWILDEMYGVKLAPVVYKTKLEAVAAFEAYYQLLMDRSAGRLA